jgi:hypothetical protein
LHKALQGETLAGKVVLGETFRQVSPPLHKALQGETLAGKVDFGRVWGEGEIYIFQTQRYFKYPTLCIGCIFSF